MLLGAGSLYNYSSMCLCTRHHRVHKQVWAARICAYGWQATRQRCTYAGDSGCRFCPKANNPFGGGTVISRIDLITSYGYTYNVAMAILCRFDRIGPSCESEAEVHVVITGPGGVNAIDCCIDHSAMILAALTDPDSSPSDPKMVLPVEMTKL